MSKLEVENIDAYFIIFGSLMIVAGIIAGNVLPWADETTRLKMGSCIEEFHFSHNKMEFQDCFKPNLDKIIATQQLNALIAVLYALGGVFIGIGVKTKLSPRKSENKTPVCNCGTSFRCPIHD